MNNLNVQKLCSTQYLILSLKLQIKNILSKRILKNYMKTLFKHMFLSTIIVIEWKIFINLIQKSSPTQYFWYRTTLDISSDINQPESFNISIAICLLIAWLLCYGCMIKGIASSGKVCQYYM
jgi:archaellum biogenesis protein FlaJ (TadC family)